MSRDHILLANYTLENNRPLSRYYKYVQTVKLPGQIQRPVSDLLVSRWNGRLYKGARDFIVTDTTAGIQILDDGVSISHNVYTLLLLVNNRSDKVL